MVSRSPKEAIGETGVSSVGHGPVGMRGIVAPLGGIGTRDEENSPHRSDGGDVLVGRL